MRVPPIAGIPVPRVVRRLPRPVRLLALPWANGRRLGRENYSEIEENWVRLGLEHRFIFQIIVNKICRMKTYAGKVTY